jgi:hypothetical protein
MGVIIWNVRSVRRIFAGFAWRCLREVKNATDICKERMGISTPSREPVMGIAIWTIARASSVVFLDL